MNKKFIIFSKSLSCLLLTAALNISCGESFINNNGGGLGPNQPGNGDIKGSLPPLRLSAEQDLTMVQYNGFDHYEEKLSELFQSKHLLFYFDKKDCAKCTELEQASKLSFEGCDSYLLTTRSNLREGNHLKPYATEVRASNISLSHFSKRFSGDNKSSLAMVLDRKGKVRYASNSFDANSLEAFCR